MKTSFVFIAWRCWYILVGSIDDFVWTSTPCCHPAFFDLFVVVIKSSQIAKNSMKYLNIMNLRRKVSASQKSYWFEKIYWFEKDECFRQILVIWVNGKFVLASERGYFRSSGRGGFFSKKRRRNFSRSRMTLRVGAIERSMFVVCQKKIFWNRASCDLKKIFYHWSKSREFHF